MKETGNFPKILTGIGVIKTVSQNHYLRPESHLNCSICCNLRKEFDEHPISRQTDDLFWSLRHFLKFGKVLGVIPIDGIFKGELKSLEFRWKSPGTIYSIFVILLLFVNVIIGLCGFLRFGGKNATEWAWSAESFVFYCMGIFTHLYFILRGKNLISIFKSWTELKLEFVQTDQHLSRDVNIVALLVYTSAILENALLQVIFLSVKQGDPTSAGKHPLERYYEEAQNHWHAFIPYSKFLSILVFFSNKFALYAWNFVDILIIMISRSLYHKFKMLNKLSEAKLIKSPAPSSATIENWKKVVKDHDTLCTFLKVFEDFLSPLVFASYAINCFYICLQLHLGLSKGCPKPLMKDIYTVWSFVHLIVRVFLVSFSAAKINDYAHKTLDILYLCPDSCETREIERMRYKISSKRIGLTGLGCFVITRPFILKIISVIFTFEIVLLQAPETSSCSPSNS